MNNAYLFSYASKHSVCPCCGKREFKALINNTGESFFYNGCRIDAGEPIVINGLEYGKCERKNNCGYNEILTPSDVFKGGRSEGYAIEAPTAPTQPKAIINFNADPKVQQTQEQWRIERNALFQYLSSLFGYSNVMGAFNRYHVGVEFDFVYWWIVDEANNYCNAHLMAYKPDGHRNKEDNQYSEDWHFSKMGRKGIIDESRTDWKRCLFGSHLLTDPSNDGKAVMIFEAEKSALIASMWFPEYICIATQSSGNFNAVKLGSLRGREIIVMPDYDIAGVGGYNANNQWQDGWKQKYEEIGRKIFCKNITFREWYSEPSVLSLEGWKPQQKDDFADYLCQVLERERTAAPSEPSTQIADTSTTIAEAPSEPSTPVEIDYRSILRDRLNTFFSVLIPCDGIGMQYFEIKERAVWFGAVWKKSLEKFFEIAVTMGVLRFDNVGRGYIFGGIRSTGLLISDLTLSEWLQDHLDITERQMNHPQQQIIADNPF